MTPTESTLAVAFFACAGLVGFAYVGYPALVWVLSRMFGRKIVPPAVETADLPTVSLLIAAHNEAGDIGNRLRNALSLHYPPNRFEIVVASDGSTDGTDEIVRGFSDRGVSLFAFPQNRGKAAVLNDSIPRLRGDVVVLSDANTKMHPDAVRRLVTWLADPSVGAVCGKLILTDGNSGRNVDGHYWKYETFLKECESRLGALLGCNGAIYAIRRHLVPSIPEGTILDDFVIPLEARRRTRCRIVFDSQALAWEDTAPDLGTEFRRRSRIGAGGFQSIAQLWPLLSPTHGWVSFTFLGHKVLRWVCPFCLVGLVLLNLLLLGVPGFNYLLAIQAGLYAVALAAAYMPARPRALRALRLTTMFASMNLALLVGFFRWITRRQRGTWQRTTRTSVSRSAEAAAT